MTTTDTFTPGSLVVLIGASGAGKTTYAARFPASWRVCLDDYRFLAADSAADQSATTTAVQIQDLLLDARLARGLSSIVDSTNTLPHIRAGLLARARYHQRPTTAVLFTVPLAVCEAHNTARERQVPTEVLRAQHQQLPTRQQLLAEGFTTVQAAPLAVA